jgi:hypothetical protein
MSRPQRDPFVAVPSTLNASFHKDYQHHYLEVFISIATRAGNDFGKENFWTAFPSIDTIAVKYNLSSGQVRQAARWLEDQGYLFVERRPNESNRYTLIYCRDLFLRTRTAEGPENAKEAFKAWIEAYKAGHREDW